VYAGLETIQEYEYCYADPESWACCQIEDDPLCRQADGYALAREFVWGDSNRFPEPLALIDNTGLGGAMPGQLETFHFLHDALGSVIGLVHGGEIVERYTYDPYGRVVVEYPVDPDGPSQGDPCSSGCDPVEWQAVASPAGTAYSAVRNPFMWTGQRYDAVTGTYHFYARTYLPHLGRWGQRDPLEYVDGVNLYEYVSSNPILVTDPLGLASISFDEYYKKHVEDSGKPNEAGFLNDEDWPDPCKNPQNFKQKCEALRRVIDNLTKSVNKHQRDLVLDRHNLPTERFPGSRIRDTVQDHVRRLIEEQEYLRRLREIYDKKCRGGGGSTEPAPQPAPVPIIIPAPQPVRQPLRVPAPRPAPVGPCLFFPFGIKCGGCDGTVFPAVHDAGCNRPT
jgi:RHS repeat-associated protein